MLQSRPANIERRSAVTILDLGTARHRAGGVGSGSERRRGRDRSGAAQTVAVYGTLDSPPPSDRRTTRAVSAEGPRRD